MKSITGAIKVLEMYRLLDKKESRRKSYKDLLNNSAVSSSVF